MFFRPTDNPRFADSVLNAFKVSDHLLNEGEETFMFQNADGLVCVVTREMGVGSYLDHKDFHLVSFTTPAGYKKVFNPFKHHGRA